MTTYEAVSLFISVAGFVTIMASLWLVYRQTRIFARQADYLARSIFENLSESMNRQSHEISRIFVEYPELRPYFYDGKTIEEDHADYLRAEAVAETILDIFWTMANQADRAVKSEYVSGDARNLWVSYVTDAFADGPILVKILTKRQNWYGQEMVEIMQAALERANRK